MSQQLVTIITPCYNESIYVLRFLDDLQCVLSALPYRFCVVVVNDGSTDDTLPLLTQYNFTASNVCIDVLNLRFNSGHQHAIYQGFLYAHSLKSNQFIVMDSDGEDAPAVIRELLRHSSVDIVNVVRSKRRESWMYQLAYRVYKVSFKMITGKQMNFGNFCLISRQVLEHAVFTSFAHFPAFLTRQQYVTQYISADKEERIGGQSKMSTRKLCHHALRSFTEFGKDLLKVLFKSFIIVLAALGVAIGIAVYKKFALHATVPGWLSILIVALANLTMSTLGFFVMGLVLHSRNKQPHSQNAIYELCQREDTREYMQA